MSATPKTRISVQAQRFEVADQTARLVDGVADVGAIVSFVGICRDEGGRLAALELEHYPDMVEAELARIVAEAASRWDLAAIGVTHRTGRIEPGEEIVAVITASSHRRDAFAAAEFIMDFLKTKAPFWKREHAADGSGATWVAAKESDTDATQRWRDRKDQ
jgi:molybdopterin synthase catalytic subunit